MKKLLAVLLALLPTGAFAAGQVIEGSGFSVLVDSGGRCLHAVADSALPSNVRCQSGALLWRTDTLAWYQNVAGVWTITANIDSDSFDAFGALNITPSAVDVNAATNFDSTTDFNGVANFDALITKGTSASVLSGTTTLPDNTATSIVRLAVPAASGTGGILAWTVFVDDGTDHQAYSGSVYISAVAKLTAETCTDPTIIGTALLSASSGTLTCTYACDEAAGTNLVDIDFTCNTSLTPTTMNIAWTLTLHKPQTITPQ